MIQETANVNIENKDGLEIATLGGGCFWCTEAVFQRIKGVEKVVSGYSGGQKENPTYQQICTGNTGHAEVIQVYFDPKVISYEDILYVFFRTHDPSTLNKQGYDEGTQYRSVIFYNDVNQKAIAEKAKKDLDAAGVWKNPAVTEIKPLGKFYKAEAYHQDYYNQNANQRYCVYVIDPKLEKLNKDFKDKLKN